MSHGLRLASYGSCLLGVAAGILIGLQPAEALEERVDDLPASVEVASVLGLDVSNPNLTFNDLSPGTTKVLGEGSFFHSVTCRSNSGRPWYLKAELLSLTHLNGSPNLPARQLKWRIVESTGLALPAGGRYDFQAFEDHPVLLYASLDDDQRGHPVVLKLQYSLTTPSDALAGTYIGQLVFTMADAP
jgi:hypothetical protein